MLYILNFERGQESVLNKFHRKARHFLYFAIGQKAKREQFLIRAHQMESTADQ